MKDFTQLQFYKQNQGLFLYNQNTCLLIDPDKLKVPDDSSFVVKESITVLVKQYRAVSSVSNTT